MTVKPKVFLIGETKLRHDDLWKFLQANGTPTWSTSAPSDGEYLVETLGRLCYQAFDTDKNPNITRIREGNDNYIANLIKQMHGSVLEHVHLNFIIQASRVFTHELVRHRHANVSQESGRFVRSDVPFDIYKPTEIADNPDANAIWDATVDYLSAARDKLVALFDLDNETIDFAFKKRLTSAIRRIAPEGRPTSIGWTANLRDLRFIIPERTSLGAEIEMREVFNQVGTITKFYYPHALADLTPQPAADCGPDVWTAEFRKV